MKLSKEKSKWLIVTVEMSAFVLCVLRDSNSFKLEVWQILAHVQNHLCQFPDAFKEVFLIIVYLISTSCSQENFV